MPCEYEDCEWLIDDLFGSFSAIAVTLRDIADIIDTLRGVEKVSEVYGVRVANYSFEDAVYEISLKNVVVVIGDKVAVTPGEDKEYFYTIHRFGMVTSVYKVPIIAFVNFLGNVE